MSGNYASKLLLTACAFAWVLCPSLASAQDTTLDSGDIDPAWLEANRFEANRQMELLVAAYALTPDQEAALRLEMEVRLQKQWAFESKELAELKTLAEAAQASGDDESTPEMLAATAKVKFIVENQPIAEDQVAGWVEKNLNVVNSQEGRLRWEELRSVQGAKKVDAEETLQEDTSFRGDLSNARTVFEAVPVPETGEPLPSGEKGTRIAPTAEKKRVDHSTVVPPNLAAANPDLAPKNAKQQAAAKQAQTAGTSGTDTSNPAKPETPQAAKPTPEAPRTPEVKPPQPAEVAPTPAPPLDDWDKYVLTLAGKYGFDDAQMTNAQSILRDLKRRANQYRMSRSDAIAKAQLMTEAKAREAELKVLNRPLDAMFEELKQRLESLPTADQRSKAGATPPAKAKDAKK